MEYSSAEMICVLKVNTDCEACKVKVMQILQRIRGVYNITIDGEDGTVKVNGRVNPNTLLNVLEKYGKHAEVKYVKFDGEVVERNPNYYGEHGYNYNPYDSMEYFSYPPPLPCPQHQGYHHHYPYFSQPPPMPPPPLVPYQFPPPQPPLVPCQFPPPPPPGPLWGPTQPTPPPPPRPYGYGPPPMTSFYPPHNLPQDEYTRQNNPNKCAMM